MRKVSVFNFMTLNGYVKGANGDLSWHRHGTEEAAFSAEGLRLQNTLLFGRITYEMMAGYWPTPDAVKTNPVVAEGMNEAHKIVFSRTLENATWHNTTLVKENMVAAIKKLKQASGPDMTILGSGSIVSQLAEHHLIDEYQFMVDPVAIGEGTPLFKDIRHKLDLKLKSTRTFESGVVLLCYQAL